jgi:hypothetical protein
MPFIAHEGMSMEWILDYPTFPNVNVACNSLKMQKDVQNMLQASGNRKTVFYLPNYYPPEFYPRQPRINRGPKLRVGCFGAIRPLKNQLIQAVAAIQYADLLGKDLRFHINATRLEGGGEPILKNLRALFDETPGTLVEHPWMNRENFIAMTRRMDIGMQVALTETFNIITADAVMNDVPVVVSPEISWVHPEFQADPTSSEDIMYTMDRALWFARKYPNQNPSAHRLREKGLRAIRQWREILGSRRRT